MAFNNVVAIAYNPVQDRLVGVEAVFQDQFLAWARASRDSQAGGGDNHDQV